MHVGEIIHKKRKEKKMTLLELSEKSGVALATLSRMENGKMTGTLQSHIDICKALEITLPELYMDLPASKKTLEVKTKKPVAEARMHDRKFSSEILVANAAAKKMMPALIKIEKGARTQGEENRSGVEKFIYILEGKVEVKIGEEIYNLGSGDTLYFDSSLAHQFKNTGAAEARLISVTCPPTL